MQHKRCELFQEIEKYIDNFYNKHGIVPTNSEIAKGLNVSTATISRYITQMCKDNILTMEGHRNVQTKKMKENRQSMIKNIPIVGNIACGTPVLADENIEGYISINFHSEDKSEYFFLKAQGQSMIDIGIMDGDYVLIKKTNVADNGQVVVALIEDEATLKRIYYKEDGIILHPENSNMEDIYVKKCLIQGVAVKIVKEIE